MDQMKHTKMESLFSAKYKLKICFPVLVVVIMIAVICISLPLILEPSKFSTKIDSQNVHINGNIKHCGGTTITPPKTNASEPSLKISNTNPPIRSSTTNPPFRSSTPEPHTRSSTSMATKKTSARNPLPKSTTPNLPPRNSITCPNEGCINVDFVKPGAEQIVYLESLEGQANWLYPARGMWIHPTKVHTAQHPRRDITETRRNWAGWIWHECGGPDIVCIESQKYKHFYYYFEHSGLGMIKYSPDPQHDPDIKLKIVSKARYDKQKGIFMSLERLIFTGKKKSEWKYLTLYVYLPPLCIGWQMVHSEANGDSENAIDVAYTIKRRLTKTSTMSHTINVGLTAQKLVESGINKGLASAKDSSTIGSSFGYSWNKVLEITKSNEQTMQLKYKIGPGEVKQVWQMVVKCGSYTLSSAETRICVSDSLQNSANQNSLSLLIWKIFIAGLLIKTSANIDIFFV